MEFPFNINDCLTEDISVVHSNNVSMDQQRSYMLSNNNNNQVKIDLSKIVDSMGTASAKAQGLRGAITTAMKLKASNHRVYILKGKSRDKDCVIGMIKVGYKTLFLLDIYGVHHECEPLCVLDFYVHESQQRHGYGKQLFQHAILRENKEAHQVAIDRPSPKFLSFLSKHYSLNNPISQMNKFNVYEAFFKDLSAVGVVDRRRRSAPVHRKMFLQDRPASRHAASANLLTINQRNNTFTDYSVTSSALNKLKNVSFKSPLVSTRDITPLPQTPQNSFLNTNQQYNVQRNPYEINNSFSRNYSRYSASPVNNPSPKPASYTTTYPASRTNKMINNLLLNNEIPSDRNMTSLDSPFGNKEGLSISKRTEFNLSTTDQTISSNNNTNTDVTMNTGVTKINNNNTKSHDNKQFQSIKDNDKSYIVSDVVKSIGNSKQKLGTSWNVFGVPANVTSTKNPYSKFKR